MEISVIITGSDKTDDTVESVLYYMTNQVLLVVDEADWGTSLKNRVHLLKGFRGSHHRNIMLGFLSLIKKWPNSDWYCCMNSDCLVGSNSFKKDLKKAEKQGIWCMGNNLQIEQEVYLPLVEMMLKTELDEVSQIMDACLFLHKKYVQKAMEVGFFERFLYLTNDFKEGVSPYEYNTLDYLLPTACQHWGGAVCQLAKWSDRLDMWIGNFKKYPMRQHELSKEECLQASIMYPVTQPIREFHKLKRGRHAKRRI